GGLHGVGRLDDSRPGVDDAGARPGPAQPGGRARTEAGIWSVRARGAAGAAARGTTGVKRVGAITIGQTPRDDIVGEMAAVLGPEVRILQAGALDGLSRSEIDGLAPNPDDADALITHLRDGANVLVAKRRIVPRLQACLDRLAGAVDAFAILCAGVFPPFTSRRPVLVPERCLAAVVDAAFDGRRLGVIVPIKEQQASSAERWSRVDPGVVVTV